MMAEGAATSGLRFAANISLLYTELPFIDRVKAASLCGFKALEVQFPYDHPVDQLAEVLQQNQMDLVLMNAPPGNWSKGERGLAALVDRQAEFADSLEVAVHYAKKLNCPRLHIMSGKVDDDAREKALSCFCDNLDYAAAILARHGLIGLIEPINPVDMPGYFLNDLDLALEVLQRVNASSLRLQFDCYHMAMTKRDVVTELNRVYNHIGHIQIAGYPGRHEPDCGSLDYRQIFEALSRMQYRDYIGCEYHPASNTDDGLSWYRGRV